MGNNVQTYPIPHLNTVTAANAAALDAAVLAAVKVIANNIIGIVDTAGAPSGNQTVQPNSIQITYEGPYLDSAGADLYTAGITWVETTQL